MELIEIDPKMNIKEAKELDKILDFLREKKGSWFDKKQISTELRIKITEIHIIKLSTYKFKNQPIIVGEYFQSAKMSYQINDYGVEFLSSGGFQKEAKKEIIQRIYVIIKWAGIIIGILASIFFVFLGIRSCVKESKIEIIGKRIESLENQHQHHLNITVFEWHLQPHLQLNK